LILWVLTPTRLRIDYALNACYKLGMSASDWCNEVEGIIRAEARKTAAIYGAEFAELVQVGRIAAWKQTARFDASRGVQFLTYALPLIQRDMRRAAMRSRSVVPTSSARTGGDTGLDDLQLEASDRPDEQLGTVEFEARVRSIVARVRAEMRGSALLMFDSIVERLQAGSNQAEKFTSDVSLVDIATKFGTSKQAVHAVESKIRGALKEALRQAA
jgi:RNA polymerase sigma factor (sigma-70 family)